MVHGLSSLAMFACSFAPHVLMFNDVRSFTMRCFFFRFKLDPFRLQWCCWASCGLKACRVLQVSIVIVVCLLVVA